MTDNSLSNVSTPRLSGKKRLRKIAHASLWASLSRPLGEGSDPFEIRWTITSSNQGFFKCLGMTGVIVDEKYIVVRTAHCKRPLNA